MKITKAVAAAMAFASLPALTPALAQAQDTAAAGIAQGATVYGPQGNPVGTVQQVSGSTVVVNTGTHTASLPANAFAKGDKGPTIGFTKEQLDAAIEAANQKADAKLDAALVPGASLRSVDNIPLGTIKSIGDDGMVTVTNGDKSFVLKHDLFATDANGLIVRAKAADINAALSQDTSAATTDSAAATTGSTPGAEPSTTATASATTGK